MKDQNMTTETASEMNIGLEEHLNEWMTKALDRLAYAEVDVPRRYSIHTDRTQQFPQQCFHEACRYVQLNRIAGMTYVLGTAVCGGMQQHAWVELPDNIVFDGTLQRFYDRTKYYDSECAMPWYRFTRNAVKWILKQKFATSRWDWELGLPWAKSAMDLSAEVLLVDRADAERYFAEKRLQQQRKSENANAL